MGIRAKDLRECIIRPTLRSLELWSPEAEELLLLTVAQESHMGYYLTQINGPALGIYQIEPATHKDIWRYLETRGRSLLARNLDIFSVKLKDSRLVSDLAYATAIARVKYLMVPESIPNTLMDQAQYWKQYYNTPLGSGTVDEAIKNYTNFVTNGT